MAVILLMGLIGDDIMTRMIPCREGDDQERVHKNDCADDAEGDR